MLKCYMSVVYTLSLDGSLAMTDAKGAEAHEHTDFKVSLKNLFFLIFFFFYYIQINIQNQSFFCLFFKCTFWLHTL